MTITVERRTTGIGSLPHHNIDAALAHSFRMGIPFLPQIPIRNPWEFMIAQALEGLPGLEVDREGIASLNPDIWASRQRELQARLERSFAEAPRNAMAFADFEPSPAISSSWQPFLWELSERRVPHAKIQLAGPMTAQWALKIQGEAPGSAAERLPELSGQIYRLVMARALAMVRRLRQSGIQPLVFLDEPGLYGLSRSNPKQVLGLQELRLLIQTLRKEGARVGLHCCSNTDWEAVLALGLDFLSFDVALSLENLLAAPEALRNFLRAGGRLSLGVIPTTRSAVLRSLNVKALLAETLDAFGERFGEEPELLRRTLREALYTPACGLALHPVSDAELVLEALEEYEAFCREALG
ncbi:MAG: hypothetical protein NDJ89_17900 [Oligoflexia bacterium]|nr:hypothetical protein [Oligoflexia bacterium]